MVNIAHFVSHTLFCTLYCLQDPTPSCCGNIAINVQSLYHKLHFNLPFLVLKLDFYLSHIPIHHLRIITSWYVLYIQREKKHGLRKYVRQALHSLSNSLSIFVFPWLWQAVWRLPVLYIKNESKQMTFSPPIQVQTCHRWCGICLEDP